MEKRYRTIVTPEGLPIDLEIAPVGSRFSAFIMDFMLMIVLLSAVVGVFAVSFDSLVASVSILGCFLIFNGYFLYFELFRQGETPGKKATGLKVVARNGGPLTTGAVFARNLMRELEIYLPIKIMLVPQLFYENVPGWAVVLSSGWVLILLFMPLFNHDRARCGDLIAGTLVVVKPEAGLLKDLAASDEQSPAEEGFIFSPEQLDMYGIKELQVLEDILRRDTTGRERRKLLRMVCDKIVRKIAWDGDIPDKQVLDFLQSFYLAQRNRLEHKLLVGERREKKRAGRLKRG